MTAVETTSYAWSPHQWLWSLIKNTNKTNKKQQIQGWQRDTPWDSRTHGCKMTDAGSNAYECSPPGWIHGCRSVCPLRMEWHTHFLFFPIGVTKVCSFWYGRAPVVKDAVSLTAGTQKLFPRSFRAPDCETHSPGKIGHWWWRVQLTIRFQVKLCCES